jgi:hypothetical protein
MFAIYIDGKLETVVSRYSLEYVVGLLRTMVNVECEVQQGSAVHLYTNPSYAEEII